MYVKNTYSLYVILVKKETLLAQHLQHIAECVNNVFGFLSVDIIRKRVCM